MAETADTTMVQQPAPGGSPIIRAEGLRKRYDHVVALGGVDLDLRAGEIIGLVGANGAGKSTLIKTLTGTVRPDAGLLIVDGQPADHLTVKTAQEAGIAAVHQELNLVPSASIAENILLWRLPRRWGFVSRRGLRKRAQEMLHLLGVDLDPDMPGAEATAVQQRLVMVAAALSQDARILILDEPTASLPPDEASHVLDVARSLRDDGRTVVFVSHRLEEVRDLADRTIVMRDGEVVEEAGKQELDIDALVALIGGRRVAEVDRAADAAMPTAAGEILQEVRHLCGTRVQDVSLDLRAGEILGIAGLVGAGRSELLRLLAGLQERSAGEIRFHADGRKKAGYIGEHRAQNLFVDFDVTGNVSLPSLPRFVTGGFVRRRTEVEHVSRVLDRIALRGKPEDPIRSLSGGNKQKALLARWLLSGVKVLFLDEPTAGIDVGARAEVHWLLKQIAKEGGAVMVAIAEPEELLSLCDRVIVLREGRLSHTAAAPFDKEEIVAAFYTEVNGAGGSRGDAAEAAG